MTQTLFQKLRDKIHRLRRLENRISLQAGGLTFVAVLLLIFLSTALAQIVFDFGQVGRWFLLIMASLSLAFAFALHILHPALKFFNIVPSSSDYQLAGHVGMAFPEVGDRLLNALQLFSDEKSQQEFSSRTLIEKALEGAYGDCEAIDFTDAAHTERLRSVLKKNLPIVTVSLAVMLIFASPLTQAWSKVLNPAQVDLEYFSFEVTVMPGDVELVSGDSTIVACIVKPLDAEDFRAPRNAYMHYRYENDLEYVRQPFRFDSLTARYMFENVRGTIHYFIEVPDLNQFPTKLWRSSEHRISVVKRPSLKKLQVKVSFPPYSRLGSTVLDENIGDFSALKGSVAEIQVHATKPLKDAVLRYSNGQHVEMSISDFSPTKASGSFRVTQNTSYTFELTDIDNVVSRDPIEYRVRSLPDEFPIINIVDPKSDVDLTEQMQIRILADLRDDFGFSGLTLNYKLEKTSRLDSFSTEFIPIQLTYLVDGSQTSQPINYIWDLGSIKLYPEDVIAFYLEVQDNDAISGPKLSRSRIVRARFPSIEEIIAEVDTEQEFNIKQAEEIARESKELEKALEEINRDFIKEKKLEWQQKENLKQILKKQEQLQEKVKEIQESLQDLEQKLSDNSMISPETMEKYMELQKLLAEINSPELQEMMKKLQQAVEQNADPRQMQELIKNFKFDQEQFSKNVERSIELLKRIKTEQMLDQLVKQAEKLSAQQQMINEMAEKAQNQDEQDALAREQERNKKSLDKLSEQSEALKDMIKDIDDQSDTQALDSAIAQMKSQQTQKDMEQSRDQLKSPDIKSPGASQKRKSIKRQLDQLSQQMQSARSSFRKQQSRQISAMMRKIVYDLVEISRMQEDVLTSSRVLTYRSPHYRTLAQKQADILTNMSKIVQNLVELSNNTFFVSSTLGKTVGRALSEMSSATSHLSERNKTRATLNEESAMVEVNNAVKILLKSMSDMQGGASSTGLSQLMEELGKMAGRQQGINDGMGSMFPNPGSGGSGQPQNQGILSPEQQAQMGRMLAEQKALQESMEAMRSKASDQNNMKGRLQNLADEMNQVIKDMENNQVDRNTINRQKQILQRLLDATKSIQEKDFSKKRQGIQAKEYDPRNPGRLSNDILSRKDQLREYLLRLRKEGFSKDYQDLIRKYFEALGNQE